MFRAMFTLCRIGFCRYGTLKKKSHFQQRSGAEQYCSGAETASKEAILVHGGGGHLNVTWRGGAYFLRVPTTRLGKNLHFDTLFRNY